MKFKELNLHPDIMKGIEEAGFESCTPVQEQTFEYTLNERDVYVQSQTGTGKTAAFLITIFQLFKTDSKLQSKRALILVPTRELAVQVEVEAQLLGKYCGLKVGSFYGGVGYDKQEKMLREGVDISVGTPGRLIDFFKSNKLNLSGFDVLVIDEADRMFDMGFIPDIRYMIKKMPAPDKRITMLYSATLSQRVKQLAWEYMNDPAEIEIQPENVTLDSIAQELYHVSREEKLGLLLGIIKRDNPDSILIFTNTKRMAELLSGRLSANGIKNEFITGDLPQKKRQSVIDGIKQGTVKALVATDVAARGLHIDDLSLVVNYDLPDDCENYVHRIGRTARAGKSGKAVSIGCESYVYNLEAIEKFIGMKIPVIWDYEQIMVDAIVTHHHHADSRHGRRHDRPERSSARGGSSAATRGQSGERGSRDNDRNKVKTGLRYNGTFKPPESAGGGNDKSRDNSARKSYSSTDKNIKLKKGATEEERLEYYRLKYGENFGGTASSSGQNIKPERQHDKKPDKNYTKKKYDNKKHDKKYDRKPDRVYEKPKESKPATKGGVINKILSVFKRKKKE